MKPSEIGNKIKFDHQYFKLWQIGNNVHLLQVFKVNYNDLSEPFKDYNTVYAVGSMGMEQTYECLNHPLPKTDLLLLIFQDTCYRHIVTVLLQWTSQEEKYYKDKVGEQFEVVVEKETK